MSYDLEAFRVPAGMTAQQLYEDDDRQIEEDAPPTPEQRAAMDRLAEAVVAVDPSVERSDGDDYVEIDTPAMQIFLYADSAAINVPYWFSGDEADAVMDRAFEYARVLTEAGGYTVYDPQTETVVEAGDDDGSSRQIMRDITARMGDLVGEEEDRPRRGWRFWRR